MSENIEKLLKNCYGCVCQAHLDIVGIHEIRIFMDYVNSYTMVSLHF